MDDPRDRFAAAVGRLALRIVDDPDMLDVLRALVDLVGGAPAVPTDIRTAPPCRPEPEPEAEPETPARETVGSRETPPEPPREPLIPLTLGSVPSVSPALPIRVGREETVVDLSTVASRCRLKAEGSRWAAERKKRIDRGDDFRAEVAPTDREVVDRARALPDCYLWMNQPHALALATDPEGVESLAQCFEAAALAAELLRDWEDEPPAVNALMRRGLELAAEAQSALRAAILRAEGPRDVDQVALYERVRVLTGRHQIYLPRFMRVDDQADPSRVGELETQLAELSTQLAHSRVKVKGHKKLLGKLRHQTGLIRQGEVDVEGWNRIAEVVGAMVEGGTSPSSLDIRQHLLPILDDLPDLGETPEGFDRALRAIDLYRDTLTPVPAEPVDRPPNPNVLRVAELLAGRTVVLIGGTPRPGACEALRTAFRLEAVDWLVTRDHQSIASFEHPVARPEVALVLLAIRWSNHSFGDVKQFCDLHGKPLVRLTAGYNPNQVADQILKQRSDQLGALLAPEGK